MNVPESDFVSSASSIASEKQIDRPQSDVQQTSWLFFRSLFSLFERSDLKFIGPGMVLAFIQAFQEPVLTVLLGRCFDLLAEFTTGEITNSIFMDRIGVIVAVIFSLGAISVALWFVSATLFCIYSDRQVQRARGLVYKSLIHKNMEWFDINNGVVGKLTLANRNLEDVRLATANATPQITRSVLTIFACFAVSIYKSWSLTLVTLAGIPVIAVASFLISAKSSSRMEASKHSVSGASHILYWTLDAISTVKLFNSQRKHLGEFEQVARQAYRSSVWFYNFQNFETAIIRVISLAMFVQGFFFGSYLVRKGKATSGDVITVFWNCISIAELLNVAMEELAVFSKGSIAMKQLMELVETATEQKQNLRKNIGLYPHPAVGDIRFNNVSFGYPTRGSGLALDGCSLDIKQGTINYIVGESGSGKSTLSALLLKLYSVNGGTILIDGLPVSSLSSRWLFDNIHVVQQHPTLFDMSILDNLKMASDNSETVSSDDIMAALDAAHVDFIGQLPDGMMTRVGSAGMLLSGGQQQRIALARAFLCKAPIMIFDESVSALDQNMRAKTIKSICDYRRGKTTLIVTHEAWMIRPSDNVFVMQNGKIAQSGTRCELETGGKFKQLFNTPSSSLERAESICRVEPLPKTHQRWSTNHRRPYSTIPDNYGVEVTEARYSKTTDIESQAAMTKLQICWRVFREIPAKLYFYVGLGVSVTQAVVNPLFSYTFSKLFIGILPGSTIETGTWSALLAGLAVLDGVLAYGHLLLDMAAEHFAMATRIRGFTVAVSQPVSWFSLVNHKASAITNCLMNNVEDTRNVITHLFSSVLSIVILTAISAIWSLIVGWKLTLLALGILPVFWLVIKWFAGVADKWARKTQQNSDLMIDLMNEVLGGIKTVKTLALEQYFMSRFKVFEEQAHELGFRRAVYTGLGSGVSQVFEYIAEGSLIWFGMHLIATGEYSTDQMILVFSLLMFMLLTVQNIINELPQSMVGFTSLAKLFNLLDAPLPAHKPTLRLQPGEIGIGANIDNISFKYNHEPVISDFSLSIARGEIVALTGQSGCGKSTIGKLLTGLYIPQRGCVKLDGLPVSDIELHSLSEHVAMVTQKAVFLPDASIAENLRYGLKAPLPSAQEHKLFECALEEVGLSGFVASLEAGLDTVVGADSKLSGGQMQRLAIARALLRQPGLLVLDEVTASLDVQNTMLIMELIAKLKGKVSILIITHQKDVCQIADRIIEM